MDMLLKLWVGARTRPTAASGGGPDGVSETDWPTFGHGEVRDMIFGHNLARVL